MTKTGAAGSKLRDDLIKTRALIDTEDKWRGVRLSDPGLCILQAANRATGFRPNDVMRAIRVVLGVNCNTAVFIFNDDLSTKHADVMRVLDRAIAAA